LRGWGFRGTPSTSRFKGYLRAVGGRTTAQAIARRGAQRATRPRGCGGGGEPPPHLLTGKLRASDGHFTGKGASERSERAERSGATENRRARFGEFPGHRGVRQAGPGGLRLSGVERGREAMRSRAPFGLAQNRMPAADADPNRQWRRSSIPRLLCLTSCRGFPSGLHLQDMQTRENGWRYR
jgi:hypothetical protein